MYCRALIRLLLIPVLLTGICGTASAIDIIAKAALGKQSYELIIRDRSFTPVFTTVDLSLTGVHDRYFLTLNYAFSIESEIETDPNGLIFYSREDINLTFGYSFDAFSVFAGYRNGATDANYGTSETNYQGKRDFGTKADGFYVGTSASYYFEGKGSLSGSIAIAALDGEVSLSEPFVDTSAFIPGVGPTPPENIKGSAVGFSLGIGWSGQISENTLYNIDLKINQFDFEDDVVFGGLDLSYEENLNTISIGLTHFFE